MNEIDIGYIAGIVDGEGWITIYPHKSGGKSRGYIYTLVRVGIANNDYGMLLHIQSLLKEIKVNAKIYKVDKTAKVYKGSLHRTEVSYQFHVNVQPEVKRFLELIQPHLQCKAKLEKALEALKLLETRPCERVGHFKP